MSEENVRALFESARCFERGDWDRLGSLIAPTFSGASRFEGGLVVETHFRWDHEVLLEAAGLGEWARIV